MPENLWPQIESIPTPRSPKTVLNEAGSGLRERTNGSLVFHQMQMVIKDDQVTVVFSIYSRALSYMFPFLTATFPVESNYPVTIDAHKMKQATANNEEELTELLSKLFSAPTTLEVIQRLISLTQT